MEYDSGSTSSDADELMENDEDDDTIHMTPHVYSTGIGLMNPFGSVASSPGGDGVGVYGADAMKLMSYQRARRKSRRSNTRKSSSSASGQSSMHSPGPASPPLLRSIESSLSINGGYFLDDPIKKEMISRRESLSLGTNDMQLSDAEQSDDGGSLRRINSHEDVPIPTPVTPGMDERRQVIRRAVTKRSNMLVSQFLLKNQERFALASMQDANVVCSLSRKSSCAPKRHSWKRAPQSIPNSDERQKSSDKSAEVTLMLT